jgi:glycosyltransferase involved in cell wall biosynthesis
MGSRAGVSGNGAPPDWRDLRVAVVGNFNPPTSGRKYQAEVLADAFENEGAEIFRVTTQQNRYLRPLCTVAELVAGRRAFDVACIQAFSNANFINAASAILLGRLLGRRVVVVYRGGDGPRFLARLGMAVIPVLNRAHRLIVPSGYLEHAFRDHGLRPKVIPNVIDLGAFPYRRRESFGPRMIWVRHLRPGYNPRMAIDVLREVQSHYPEATLVLAGEGILRSALEHQVADLGIRGVTFAGQVNQATIAQLLDRADVFISTTNYDNQPRSLLEAMAAGLPVVSTKVGGVPFLIQDRVNGILVPKGDVSRMAEAVLNIVQHPALGRTLVEEANRRLQQFTWPSVKREWLAALSGHEVG